jgi:hypothetical protein
VQLEPALLDSVLDAAPKSASLPLRDIKKRRVDLLNMNAVVLDGLSGELNQLTRPLPPDLQKHVRPRIFPFAPSLLDGVNPFSSTSAWGAPSVHISDDGCNILAAAP